MVVSMLNEGEIIEIMEFIERHTAHGPVVRHLTELYKLRDEVLYSELLYKTMYEPSLYSTSLKLFDLRPERIRVQGVKW
jgi:hypothetical protein